MLFLPSGSGVGISPSPSPTPKALHELLSAHTLASPLACLSCASALWISAMVSGANRRYCPGALSLHRLSCPYRPRRHFLKSWETCGQRTTSTWSSLGLEYNRGGAHWSRRPPPMCKQLRTSFGGLPWPEVRVASQATLVLPLPSQHEAYVGLLSLLYSHKHECRFAPGN